LKNTSLISVKLILGMSSSARTLSLNLRPHGPETSRDWGAAFGRLVAVLLILLAGCQAEHALPTGNNPAKETAVDLTATNRQLRFENNTSPRPEGLKQPSQISADLDEISTAANPRTEHHLRFSDVALKSGVDFIYQNGAKGQSLMVESAGGGCGWLDYDSDGHWDLYLVQGGDPTQPPSAAQPSDRIFRSLGKSQFVDVTEFSRIDERGYGQGTAVADFDGDGFDDIFVTNVGQNHLFRNQGDGTFSEVQSQLFAKESHWSSSAAWGDIDRDGDLDLYVCRYVDYDPMHPKRCFLMSGGPGICHPKEVNASPDECYLNLGNGEFLPVAQERGLYGPNNRALGVAIADLNNDGWPDIFVANDTTENFLFMNQQNGKFQEQAQLLGCAVNINGSSQANMGIAVGDYDRNGFLDLYITHFHNEWNTLYQNLGKNGFHDVTAAADLSLSTMNKLGWGTVMADFDQDGQEELVVANGHLTDLRSDGIDFPMTPQLFAFNGSTWDNCTDTAGPFFQHKVLGRGIATCDYDEDGDLDFVMVSQNDRAAILRNDSKRGHWLKLSLIGNSSNRRGVGARVTLRTGNRTLIQELAGGTSYCSANQPVLIFGLGNSIETCELEIRWPNGDVQQASAIRPDQSLVVRQSSSQATIAP
jgi:hypothetical protein